MSTRPARARTRHLTRSVIVVVLAVVATAIATVQAAPAEAAPLPVVYSTAAALKHLDPNTPPPGANNWNCRPSAAHPQPVILVHGTIMNQQDNWFALSPLLVNNGYCVFTFNYGGPPSLGFIYGLAPIEQGAGELATFVDRVRGATGAATVDLVGHSQGGMMPHYYIKFLGGASKVRAFVGLAPSNQGTTLHGFTTVARLFGLDNIAALACFSCVQQMRGSNFLTRLNQGGVVQPGIRYTVVSTQYDELVVPWQSAFLPAGPNVKNIRLQDACWSDFSGHIGMVFSPNTARLVLNALDPANARSSCEFVPTIT
jgi:triacylglycerol esterase/lipase EstA (alpha/beta hydrolase family)